MAIRWGTLIADVEGNIDQARLRSTAAVGLAILGGIIIAVGMLCEVFGKTFGTDTLWLGAGALVLPLTGGKVADIFVKRNGSNGGA